MLQITLNKISLQPLFILNLEPTFIIIFMQGFPKTWKLFQKFLQGKKFEKGYVRHSVGLLEWRIDSQ
jgi:hypothetical protein